MKLESTSAELAEKFRVTVRVSRRKTRGSPTSRGSRRKRSRMPNMSKLSLFRTPRSVSPFAMFSVCRGGILCVDVDH